MTLESFLMIVAPLSLFIFGVLIIPFISKNNLNSKEKAFKLIDDFEKKYIY